MSKYKIAIDAGHGSNTPGKRHPDGYREHYSNTYIAYYLDQILRNNGIETFKVSWNDNNVKDDQDIPLGTRQAQIKAAGCTISVSIHANAFGNGVTYNTAKGIETYYHASNSYAKDSKRLAEYVHARLIKGTPQTNRGIKRADFAMCNCSAMGVNAAILIETAFMTNKEESDLLKSDKFLLETAKEIAQGIFDYLGISGNVNASGSNNNNQSPVNENKPAISAGPSGGIVAGLECKVTNAALYATSTATTVSSRKTGTYYIWSADVVNGRVRVTNSKANVGKSGQITGWMNASDLGLSSTNNSSASTPTTPAAPAAKTITAGMSISLKNTPLYSTSSTKTISSRKTGTYYVWNSSVVNGRVRITNSKANVGKSGQITGWVNTSDI